MTNYSQRGKCLALLCHAQAGAGHITEAFSTFAMMEERGYKRYSKIKDYLALRYRGGTSFSDEEISEIEELIVTEEMKFLMAA